MTGRWNVPEKIEKAGTARVFSGGACNILDGDGQLLRNVERDAINDWLTEKDIVFYDPQIHPDTHGTEYNYEVHHPIEVAARRSAQLHLYEVSPRTFGGITSFEIAVDSFSYESPMVIYYSDGNAGEDKIPQHSSSGHPLFVPYGLVDRRNEAATKAHYKEFVKNANNMRKYLARFAEEMSTLTVIFGEHAHENDIVITSERMHASDLFRAVVLAASGQRTFVNFKGGPETRDEKGNPLLMVPSDPPINEMRALLDQYMDEGNQLRRMIAKMMEVNVFVRIVYTQHAAIAALEELMRIKNFPEFA